MDKDNDSQKIDKESLGTFINPRTDFGFHRIFSHADMLKSFLNEVFAEEKDSEYITSMIYLPPERFGEIEDERHVIFDIRCKTSSGEEIVVEMQNARPDNFVSRIVFYSTYPIRNQAPPRRRRGKNGNKHKKWNYNLKAIYIVVIVNFPMLKGKSYKDIVIDWIKLMSVKTKKPFSDIVNFVIIDLTKFNRKESELKTPQDCWLYTLKHAEILKDRPEEIRNKLFIDLYDYILPTNKLTEEEMKEYNNSVLELESLSLFTDYAKMEGIKIGRNEGIEIGEKRGIKIGRNEGIEIGRNAGRNEGIEIAFTQIVINAAKKGMSLADISNITTLSVEQICNILKNKKK